MRTSPAYYTAPMRPELMEVVHGIGDFIEYWGFKKIHGRIWALIFLSKEPVNAKFLMQHLNVSKALVSMSLKVLLEYDVIQMCPKTQGSIHYTSNSNLTKVILNVILQREAKMILKIKNSCDILQRSLELGNTPTFISSTRLRSLIKMVKMADSALRTMVSLKQFDFHKLGKALIFNNERKK